MHKDAMDTNVIPKSSVAERRKAQNVQIMKECRALLNLLYSLNKTLKLYNINNELAVEQMKALYLKLKDAVLKYNEASILLHQNSLFFNGVKVKFGYSTYHLYRYIDREFRDKDIGLLSFSPGINEKQLKKFISVFGQKGSEESDNDQDFEEALKAAGIETVSVEPFFHEEKEEEEQDTQKKAAKTYFWSITHLKEIFNKFETGKKIPILTTKRLIQTLFMRLEENESFLEGLTTIKNFDDYTLNHSVNVCILSLAMGRRLGLDKSELIDLGLSALFHDIGKLDIPKEILLKPGKLDEEERNIIENHPKYGAESLVQLRNTSYIPASAVSVAMEHHAGSGNRAYPRYTKKKNISFYSRIVKIVDVFDAITTKRPYRKKDFTKVEALSFMAEKFKEDFDPLLLKVFIQMIGSCPIGTLVLLDTGEIGIVTASNPNPAFPFRPRIKLISDAEGHRTDGALVDLAAKDPDSLQYKLSIVKILNPDDYDIRISDYFVAQSL